MKDSTMTKILMVLGALMIFACGWATGVEDASMRCRGLMNQGTLEVSIPDQQIIPCDTDLDCVTKNGGEY